MKPSPESPASPLKYFTEIKTYFMEEKKTLSSFSKSKKLGKIFKTVQKNERE